MFETLNFEVNQYSFQNVFVYLILYFKILDNKLETPFSKKSARITFGYDDAFKQKISHTKPNF